jgi:NAD(P)-dependent dehydrogenase (short-subunit alcohol dehydrogenase family)
MTVRAQSGKVVVTGASRVLGLRICEALAREGEA